MRAVVAGDARAQERLVLRVLPHLRAIARTLLSGSADADDAVQVTLMKVLHAAKDYRAEGSLERWVRRIAVRTCLRVAKRERRHHRALDTGTEVGDVPAIGPGPRLAEQLPRDVDHYLARLPEAQREALLLRHALDYSLGEIAELTAAPVDTVKSRLLFGRRALRKLVRQDLAISAAKASLVAPDGHPKDEKKHA
jgi:RNA polymerase sigma-70 factor (ECF subfamily)